MKQEQLHQIIKDKNEQRERHVLRTAEDIIESIVQEQQTIIACNERIESLRKELTTLQVQELDAATILGAK